MLRRLHVHWLLDWFFRIGRGLAPEQDVVSRKAPCGKEAEGRYMLLPNMNAYENETNVVHG